MTTTYCQVGGAPSGRSSWKATARPTLLKAESLNAQESRDVTGLGDIRHICRRFGQTARSIKEHEESDRSSRAMRVRSLVKVGKTLEVHAGTFTSETPLKPIRARESRPERWKVHPDD